MKTYTYNDSGRAGTTPAGLRKIIAWATACAVVSASALQAQTVSIYTGLGSNADWSATENWDTGFFPDAPDALAQFSQAVDTDRINMRMNSDDLAISQVHQTAGILVQDGFVANPVADANFLFRNVNTGTTGMLRIHGFDTTINGDPATGLVANFSDQDISFSTVNASFQIELAGSGHFHVEKPGVQTRVIVGITETDGSHGIVKTGAGILHFGTESQNSNYSGGFTLEEGIVQWTNSGGASANPFGIGPLTMQGGTFRSTTDGGRTLNSDIVLDGGATLGSLEEGHTGNVTVNSAGGSLETTIVSDSTVTIHQTTNWHQTISGNFGLTKDGEGTLVFTGTGGDVLHTGATIIAAGTLLVNSNVTDSDVTVQSGAILGFGTSGNPGEGTFGQTVTLENGATIAFRLDDLNDHDSMVAQGLVSLDGAVLEIELGFQPNLNDVFVLIDNQSGMAIDGLLEFEGNTLAEGEQFTVNGAFSQTFEISYLHDGDSLALTAVPEPSTWALIAGIFTMGFVVWRRRRA